MGRDARCLVVGLVLAWAPLALAQSARLVLRWKDVAGAKGYELQIAKDPSFVEVVLQTRVPTPAYKWEQLPSVTHWWRVRSFDAESRASEWSQPRTVSLESTVPVPRSPADDALLPCAQAVELAFEPSPLVKEFLVEVSQSKDFVPARQVSSRTPNVSLGVVSAGVWYWRAKAIDMRDRTGESSQARRFTIRPAAPKARPAADVVLGAPSVTLSWSEVACATSWVLEASSDSKDKVSLTAPGPSLVFKPNAAGEYRWRVAAIDERGTPGEWSQESVFRVRLATPTPRGESSTPLKLDLAWSPVVGASQYRVEIAAERDFKQLLTSGVVTASQFRATDVTPGQVFWRVQARDDKGHSSAFTEPRAVDVVAPEPLEAVVLSAPAADVVVKPGEPVELVWGAVDKAVFYELEVDERVTQVPSAPKTLTELAEGAHVVRVRAKGNASRVSPWTEPREIFVGTPPVSRALVTIERADELRVVLKDGKGRVVRGLLPKLAVEKGAVGPVVEKDGVYTAAWTPPADGEDVLRIEERDFVTELELARPLPAMVSVAARAGGLFNFSSVASPTITFGLTWRPPVLSRRLGLEARAGVYAASRSVDFGVEQVRAQAWVFPFSVLVGWHQPIGAYVLHGGVGPAFQLAFLTVGGARETRVVGDLELAVGVGRKLGPGFLEVEVSGLFGALDGQLAKLATSGLGLRLGYSFELGGR
ncbi:MAG: hypothetical protein JNJ54_23870 [Myxococcaceae bacterium]|nr:hypothetical protein [Myxococcaceae bacterium]